LYAILRPCCEIFTRHGKVHFADEIRYSIEIKGVSVVCCVDKVKNSHSVYISQKAKCQSFHKINKEQAVT
jgi:hypothetical protein